MWNRRQGTDLANFLHFSMLRLSFRKWGKCSACPAALVRPWEQRLPETYSYQAGIYGKSSFSILLLGFPQNHGNNQWAGGISTTQFINEHVFFITLFFPIRLLFSVRQCVCERWFILWAPKCLGHQKVWVERLLFSIYSLFIINKKGLNLHVISEYWHNILSVRLLDFFCYLRFITDQHYQATDVISQLFFTQLPQLDDFKHLSPPDVI